MGFPLWSVQLLGRWGGGTVKQYVGAAALDVFTEPPAPGVHVNTNQHTDLSELLADTVLPEPPASSPSSVPARVEAAVQALAGGLREELRAALRAELTLLPQSAR